MDFKDFNSLLQKHVAKMMEEQDFLFMLDVNKDELWDTYLNSYPEGTNEIYRERRYNDCNCCKQFIRAFGNVVFIKNNKLVSIWDFTTGEDTYQPVIDALSALVHSKKIKDVFVTKEVKFGIEKNFEELITWYHFFIQLPKKFVTVSEDSVPTVMAEFRDIRNVFERSLKEISQEAIEIILDLIPQKSLYKGDEWKDMLDSFLLMHKEYHKLPDEEKDLYCWSKAVQIGSVLGKIRNRVIGTLLVDVSNNMDLNEAVMKYGKKTDPINYQHPKTLYSKKICKEAKKTFTELGLMPSIERRFATIKDININNILFANKEVQKQMAGDVFDTMSQEAVSANAKKFDKIEEIGIEKFVKDIIPRVSSIEVLLENRHAPNLMSVIAPKYKDCNALMKWDNSYTWVYKGNITDSMMKERVKMAGGKIDGILRYSIQWNECNDNNNDFDAHCIEPDKNLISFPVKTIVQPSSGMLDVDIINPNGKVAVENITWTDIRKMQEGIYTFLVHNYTHRGGRSGFSAEIEYNGEIYSYSYRKDIRQKGKIIVAKIKFSRENGIEFIESLDSTTSSKKLWDFIQIIFILSQ